MNEKKTDQQRRREFLIGAGALAGASLLPSLARAQSATSCALLCRDSTLQCQMNNSQCPMQNEARMITNVIMITPQPSKSQLASTEPSGEKG